MTDRTEALTQASAPAFAHDGSYVDWPAIFAGAVVASAIAFVFTTFGAALGLTLTSPYEGEGSAIAALIAVGSWMLWTTISSFMAGGYIAGRMRRRIDLANADEVGIRDGIHGLTVWGVAVMLGAVLLVSTVDTAAKITTETTATVAAVADDVTANDGVDDETAANGTEETAVPDAATVSEATGVSEAEAKAAAEAARKYSVISAFVLAASLLIAGAAAYWAASMGGQHRDEGRASARFGRWT